MEFVKYTVPSTTSWTKVSRTFTVPTFSGKTFGETNYMCINISPNYQLNSVYTLDIAQVQLEEGSVATPFEVRPYGLELALCQRYYRTLGVGSIGQGQVHTASAISFPAYYEQMRAAPTVVLTKTSVSAGASELCVNGIWVTASSLNILNNYLDKNGGNIVIQGFSGLTAGQTALFNNVQQILALSAEL